MEWVKTRWARWRREDPLSRYKGAIMGLWWGYGGLSFVCRLGI
ncbi:Hypothetical protein Cul210932_0238 [Corynebacterium ulcerans]|nr:Hypothetical protein Cul210932_0238 [Corynebacterium ulcerans]